MAKRCPHPRLKSFRFKSGEIMTMCPDCKHGENHYDQSTPILGKLYTRYRTAVQEVEPESDVADDCIDTELEEIAELQVGQTFVTIDAEVPEVPTVEPGEESDSGEVEVAEEIEA